MRAFLTRVCILALLSLSLGSAQAATPLADAQQAELDRVRGEVAGQIQLSAYDLLDELVYGWLQDPVFQTPTPVVLAGLTVPVGLGTGLQALLETHLSALLTQNPSTNLQLVHCPSCTAVVVHSSPNATVISRGIDDPSLLAELGDAGDKHALFIDVEAEGTWLVLRARLTELNPALPIVWSRMLSVSTSTPAMLRQPDDLKSAAEARQEYLGVLEERGQLAIPVRLGIRNFAQPDEDAENPGTQPPPFLWLQTGVELALTDSRAWISSFVVGYSIIPQAYQGLMGQVRMSRLVTGNYRSLTRPDVYLFGGGALMTVWGPATGSFVNDSLDTDAIIRQLDGDDPRALFGTFHGGLDVRIGNRMGVNLYLEWLPSFRNSSNFGQYVSIAGIGFQSFGSEVTFWI